MIIFPKEKFNLCFFLYLQRQAHEAITGLLFELTPDDHDSEDNPEGPVRKVLDEDKGHKGTDNDEVGLLEE